MVDDMDPAHAKKKKKSTPNPEYSTWLAQDQLLLGYLTNSVVFEVLAQVAHCTSFF